MYSGQEYTSMGMSPQQQRNPIMYHEQIDQMVLTPEAQTTNIIKKIPRMVKKPIYELDSQGLPIPILVDNKPVFDERGQQVFKILKYELVQEGYTAKSDFVPASELLYVDYSTSNLSYEACSQLARTGFLYSRFLYKQNKTSQDYSNYLHKLRNDNLIILNSFKSLNGGTLQAVKTFINKTFDKQWIKPLEEKKPAMGFFGGKPKEEPEKNYTGFQV